MRFSTRIDAKAAVGMVRVVGTAHRTYVSYIDRSREYYAAQGYERPYEWARFDDVPFARLAKPLAESRIGVVTTSSVQPNQTEPCAISAQPPPQSMHTADRFWDKDATHTDDVDTFLPLTRLAELRDAGLIGSLSQRFYGVHTEYSQRLTKTRDAPQVETWCRQDDVDCVLLAPL